MSVVEKVGEILEALPFRAFHYNLLLYSKLLSNFIPIPRILAN
jgi:hypothetical protein